MSRANKWYVITGGPSSGKTTLLTLLEKQGHKTFPEAARVYIDEEIAKGRTIEDIRKDEQQFQLDIVHKKIAIEASHDPAQVTFFDRGMHDSTAYINAYGWSIHPVLKKATEETRYQKVFLLEPLPTFTKDYARTEDAEFTKRLTELLVEAYRESGMDPIRVPVLEPEERVRYILEYINQEG